LESFDLFTIQTTSVLDCYTRIWVSSNKNKKKRFFDQKTERNEKGGDEDQNKDHRNEIQREGEQRL